MQLCMMRMMKSAGVNSLLASMFAFCQLTGLNIVCYRRAANSRLMSHANLLFLPNERITKNRVMAAVGQRRMVFLHQPHWCI
jgi:hypothetical protein